MSRLGPSSHFPKDVNLNLVDVDPFTDTQRLTHKILDIAQTEPFNVCVTQGSSPEAPARIPGPFMRILMTVQTISRSIQHQLRFESAIMSTKVNDVNRAENHRVRLPRRSFERSRFDAPLVLRLTQSAPGICLTHPCTCPHLSFVACLYPGLNTAFHRIDPEDSKSL